ncbi:MAG: 6-carboxytetrahydropterin synthase [Desulfovibrio sp.]|nr:6-carboxytetrahydropterin synthase [Desulfovibrio sp.]
MLSVTSRHYLCAAHRLYDYNGSCERLHGHNYLIELTIRGEKLNAQGMVIDFAIIKKILLSALDENWDHRTLLYDQDPLCSKLGALLDDGSVAPVPFNPTAENIAQYLGQNFFPRLLKEKNFLGLEVVSVTVFETAKNSATWTIDATTCQ